MRDLDEVGLGQDTDEFFAQAAIGRFEILRGAASPADRPPGRSENRPRATDRALRNTGSERWRRACGQIAGSLACPASSRRPSATRPPINIRLPQRNETIPRLRRGRLAMRFVHEAFANAVRTIASANPSDLISRRSVTFGRRNDFYGENITSLRPLRHRPGRELASTSVTPRGAEIFERQPSRSCAVTFPRPMRDDNISRIDLRSWRVPMVLNVQSDITRGVQR